MYEIFIALRPWQWTKNLLIFVPFLLTFELISPEIFNVFLVFLCFNLFVSSTYIFNDLKDAELDKLHSEKKNRPIASGRLKVSTAKFIGLILFFTSLSFSYLVDEKVSTYFIFYALVTFSYTKYFKYIFLIDTLSISFLFLMRVIIGGVASDVAITPYLGSFIFLTSCLLSTSKKISILKSKMLTTNSFSSLIHVQDRKYSLLRIYSVFGFLSYSSFTIWLINLINTSSINKNVSHLFISNITYLVFIYLVYRFSVSGELEDFSKELFKNKYLFFVSLILVLTFFIGYF